MPVIREPNMVRVGARGPGLSTAEVAAAHLRWERERARATRARAFCARDQRGRPASMCLLMATPHATEVELVYTTPAQRRRGLAYATVARAAAEADDGCTFLFT